MPDTPLILSALALLVSLLSLLVAYAAHRSSGARVRVVHHQLVRAGEEYWLAARIANSGRSSVDIDGAWTNWLGASRTSLPTRLASGSGLNIVFRGSLPPARYESGPLMLTVGLGTGETLVARLALTEAEERTPDQEYLIDLLDSGFADSGLEFSIDELGR